MTSTLVFIHGAGCRPGLWPRELMDRSGFEVKNLELPALESHQRPSVHEYASKIALVLKDCESIILCGHSLGGAIALELALRFFPEKVMGLILVGTGARLRVDPLVLKALRWPFLYRLVLKKTVANSCFAQAPRSVRENVFAMMSQTKRGMFLHHLRACNIFDVMDDIKQIRVPTLILCGDEDRLTPPKYSEFLHREIKGSELVIFPHAGHMLPIERPVEIMETIMKWLNRTFGLKNNGI